MKGVGFVGFWGLGIDWASGIKAYRHFGFTHRPLSSSCLWLIFRFLLSNPQKELLRGLWVGLSLSSRRYHHPQSQGGRHDSYTEPCSVSNDVRSGLAKTTGKKTS